MVLPEGLDLRSFGATYIQKAILCGKWHLFNGLKIAIEDGQQDF
jgi:hypothetical protein